MSTERQTAARRVSTTMPSLSVDEVRQTAKEALDIIEAVRPHGAIFAFRKGICAGVGTAMYPSVMFRRRDHGIEMALVFLTATSREAVYQLPRDLQTRASKILDALPK